MFQPNEQLSAHFGLIEFTRSHTANAYQIDNTPTPTALANLKRLADFLELVRTTLGGATMIISSGYRAPHLNRIVGGVANSYHLHGLACDFTAPKFGNVGAICQKLAASDLLFDQLILERSKTAEWVHISIHQTHQKPRRQVLKIDTSKQDKATT